MASSMDTKTEGSSEAETLMEISDTDTLPEVSR